MKTHQIKYECGYRTGISPISQRLNRNHSPHLRLLALAVLLCFPALSSFGAVLIDLDARGLSEGPLATWTNTGSVLGDFTSAGAVVPQVTNVAGVHGVGFIATSG